MSDTKDKEDDKKAEEIVTLRALGTYPMPMPVRRGSTFERPRTEAMGYVARGKAEVVKGHAKKTAAADDETVEAKVETKAEAKVEAKADAGKDRPTRTTRSPE